MFRHSSMHVHGPVDRQPVQGGVLVEGERVGAAEDPEPAQEAPHAREAAHFFTFGSAPLNPSARSPFDGFGFGLGFGLGLTAHQSLTAATSMVIDASSRT